MKSVPAADLKDTRNIPFTHLQVANSIRAETILAGAANSCDSRCAVTFLALQVCQVHCCETSASTNLCMNENSEGCYDRMTICTSVSDIYSLTWSMYGPWSTMYDQPGPSVGSFASLDRKRFLNRKHASMHSTRLYRYLIRSFSTNSNILRWYLRAFWRCVLPIWWQINTGYRAGTTRDCQFSLSRFLHPLDTLNKRARSMFYHSLMAPFASHEAECRIPIL